MADQPNILFICTDQQFAGAMNCAGNDNLSTPGMDRIAAAGTRFDRAYCTHPLCAPARASFVTGLMPHQAGVTGSGHVKFSGATSGLVAPRGAAVEGKELLGARVNSRN